MGGEGTGWERGRGEREEGRCGYEVSCFCFHVASVFIPVLFLWAIFFVGTLDMYRDVIYPKRSYTQRKLLYTITTSGLLCMLPVISNKPPSDWRASGVYPLRYNLPTSPSAPPASQLSLTASPQVISVVTSHARGTSIFRHLPKTPRAQIDVQYCIVRFASGRRCI